MEPFLGQICLFPYNFVPMGWLPCDGSLLSIQSYSALFALLGTTYGGNGTSNFALPDLRSRVPIGVGQGPNLSSYVLGAQAGAENVALAANQIPGHSHTINVSAAAATTEKPLNAFLAQSNGMESHTAVAVNSYGATATAGSTLAAGSVNANAGGAAHPNIQPVLALQYCIAIQGVFPSHQ
jgi:microcystin-dependent protein